MKWKKLGLIYAPDGSQWWARSYAHLPTADIVDDRFIRVYFAGLDENKYGRIGFVDLDIDEPTRILKIGPEPILDLGERGTFDDCGVNPCCLVHKEGRSFFYYIGWQRMERVPYMLYTGLAVSRDGEHWERNSPVPVLERTASEPFLRSAITVMEDEGRFKGWYVSGLGWEKIRDAFYPTYVIRYAESNDGKNWISRDRVCIDFQDPDEFGFGRPWVVKDGGLYRMWYSIRSRTRPYRIGYAESRDGLAWTRLDGKAGIEKSASGWDSEMVCYPCVIDVRGKRYMFYNGNRHGASGFGLAVLEEE